MGEGKEAKKRGRRASGSWRGPRGSRSGRGRSRTPPGSATCSPSNWSRPVSGSSTCNPSWRPGCGCWRPSRPTRTIHMAAVTQIRHRHSPGRVFYDRKIAEGKTSKEALRALKRRVSDALWVAMVADARRAAAHAKAGPGGQPGNDSVASAAGSHPETPALRPSHSRTRTKATTTSSRAPRSAPRSNAKTTRRTA